GQVWIRIFPDKPVTKKPAEVRMGKGKGAPEYWVAVVRPGRILFEAEGVPLEIAKEALRLAAQKLPVQTKFVIRRDYVAYTLVMSMGLIRGAATHEIIYKLHDNPTQYRNKNEKFRNYRMITRGTYSSSRTSEDCS